MAGPLQSIGGLASGLDTNTIVAQLMQIERQPLVRSQRQEGVETARRQALLDVKSRLTNLSNTLAGLRDATTWANVQKIDSTDSTRVTGSTTGTAPAGAYTVTVSQLATAHQVKQTGIFTTVASDDQLYITEGTGTTYTVDVAAGDDVNALATKINAVSNISVNASVYNGKLVLTGKDTGAANTISVTSRNGDLLRGWVNNATANDLGLTTSVAAQDASFTVNGTGYTRSKNTVDDVVFGLSIQLKGVTSSTATLTVGAPAPDTTLIQSKVQAFVDQYNSTVDFIQGKLKEKKVANPALQSDREKGVLSFDTGLASLLSKMRQAVTDVFSGRPSTMQTLGQAGLSTGATTGSATLNQDSVSGKLTLDTTKLQSALTSNFADVKAMLTNVGSSYADKGLSQRLDDITNAQISASTGLLSSRISSEDSLITRLQGDQKTIQTRLDLREKKLRAQFTAMEKALSNSQSQGQWLSGQVAALGR